jgi:predicted XRE-type DNA-binding protein
MSDEEFASVWDAIEDTAANAEKMKLRFVLIV